MEMISDDRALQDWLNGKEMAFSCVLAARAALRIVPVMEIALCDQEEERRRTIVLPSFRALAAANFAGAWPGHARKVRNSARIAGQEAGAAINDLIHSVQVDELKELGIAERAVNAVVEATQSVVTNVDAGAGIGSPAALVGATVEVARFALSAIDGIHGVSELSVDLEEQESDSGVPQHIEEFWNAVALDAKWLEDSENAENKPEDAAAALSEKALWPGGTPVWASRQWADFKDRLPEVEGWEFWIGWYEGRLAGRRLDAQLEPDLVNIPNEEWKQGPAHVNTIIARLVASRFDPLLAAIARGFEDLEQVKQVSSIDLRQHSDRIRDALPKDPYQAVGATKDMLEATMKTILDRRGKGNTRRFGFSELTTQCLRELGLRGDSCPATEGDRHVRKIASSAQKMILTVNELRNRAGTGHGRVAGKEPIVTAADAALVASTGMNLAAWLLHHDADA